MYMQTTIAVMTVRIIVQSGMKMVFRLLADQILSSLGNLRWSDAEGMREK